MLGVVVLLLAVAIPIAIVMFAVKATEAEREIYGHTPVSRLTSALVFGLAALLGVLWMIRGNGPEYFNAMSLLLGIPASGIAATLAAAGQPLLAGHSKAIATFSGIAIAVLTLLITSSLIAVFFTPSSASSFVAAFGVVVVLSSSSNFPNLLIGGLAGLLLSHFSNRK